MILCDQASKFFVALYLNEHESLTVVPKYFRFTLVRNEGGALGFLKGQRVLFIIISVIFISVLSFILIDGKDLSRALAYGLVFIIAGACGNMLDRIVRKSGVVDFIDITLFKRNLPVANIADLSLLSGMIILIVGLV